METDRGGAYRVQALNLRMAEKLTCMGNVRLRFASL